MGKIFEYLKKDMNFPEVGDKIIYYKPTKASWFKCVIDNEKLLTLGSEYTVDKTELNSSSSYVWLKEFPETEDHPNRFFNLAAFTKNKNIVNRKESISLLKILSNPDDYKGADHE